MKNVIRIFFVSIVLIGGTGLFAYWSVIRFNNSLDTLRDTCYAIAKQPTVLACEQTGEEQIPVAVTEDSVSEPIPAPTPGAELETVVPTVEPTPVPTPEPTPTPESNSFPAETSL
jgi:hypothetical protein